MEKARLALTRDGRHAEWRRLPRYETPLWAAYAWTELTAKRVIGLLGAVVIAALWLAAATGASSPPSVIRVISLTATDHPVDLPPKGVSVGDHDSGTDKLVNQVPQFGKPSGAVVGSDFFSETLIAPHVIKIVGGAKLPGGTLAFKGRLLILTNGTLVAPVVGGTGVFAGAHGTTTASAVKGHPNQELNVYRLTYR